MKIAPGKTPSGEGHRRVAATPSAGSGRVNALRSLKGERTFACRQQHLPRMAHGRIHDAPDETLHAFAGPLSAHDQSSSLFPLRPRVCSRLLTNSPVGAEAVVFSLFFFFPYRSSCFFFYLRSRGGLRRLPFHDPAETGDRARVAASRSQLRGDSSPRRLLGLEPRVGRVEDARAKPPAVRRRRETELPSRRRAARVRKGERLARSRAAVTQTSTAPRHQVAPSRGIERLQMRSTRAPLGSGIRRRPTVTPVRLGSARPSSFAELDGLCCDEVVAAP